MVKVKATITVTYENFPDEDNEIVIHLRDNAMLYQVQISESNNGKKIIRYETVATYYEFKDAYTHFIELLLNDDSELYNYRILEGNTVIEDAEDIKQLQAEGKMNVLW